MKSERKIYREEANLARSEAESWSTSTLLSIQWEACLIRLSGFPPSPGRGFDTPSRFLPPPLPLLGGGVDAIELIGAYLYLSGPVARLKNERFRGGRLPVACYLLG